MKKITLLMLTTMLLYINSKSQNTKWNIDASHSSVQFSVSHMIISEATGRFSQYEGIVLADNADFSDAKIDFTISVGSIDTDDEKRDDHLKSPDFFDATQFPAITFKSKSFQKAGNNMYKLTGDLTIHGVTKTVILDVKYGGTVKDPWGNTKAGFKISGTINRTDFGLKYNSVLEAGGLMIGEEVTILCNMELSKQK